MLGFINSLPVWGPLAVGAALVPTYQDIFALELVSEYWQPGLNQASAVLSGLGASCTYALLFESEASKRKWTLIGSVIGLIISLAACLLFKALSLADRFRDTLVVDVINGSNLILYVVVFVSFSVVLMGVYLLCGVDKWLRNHVDIVALLSRIKRKG